MKKYIIILCSVIVLSLNGCSKSPEPILNDKLSNARADFVDGSNQSCNIIYNIIVTALNGGTGSSTTTKAPSGSTVKPSSTTKKPTTTKKPSLK